jgi:glutamine cyclotransferase
VCLLHIFVVNAHPGYTNELHYRQGLSLDQQGVLYESTGLFGQSKLRRIQWPSGKIIGEVSLPHTLFGEGSTVVGENVIMLTWKSRKGLIFNKQSLEQRKTFTFSTTTGQGWGITETPKRLVVSDGSSFLHSWDKQTLAQTHKVQVKDGRGRPVERLNELEFVAGEVLANVWFDKRIARIDPDSGKLLGWIDCTKIHHGRPFRAGDDVLNGIALLRQPDEGQSHPAMPLHGVELLLTGKKWDKLYHVRLQGKLAS